MTVELLGFSELRDLSLTAPRWLIDMRTRDHSVTLGPFSRLVVTICNNLKCCVCVCVCGLYALSRPTASQYE